MFTTEIQQRNRKRERHPVEILIDQARALLRPSPVDLHHLPAWLAKRIRARFGHLPGCCNSFCRLQRVAIVAGRGRDSWLDHWGCTVLDGRKMFVAEPYTDVCDLAAAQRFADALGLDMSISANAWWYPSMTLRLTFYPLIDDSPQTDQAREQSGGPRNKRNNGGTASRGASRRPAMNVGTTRDRNAGGDAVGAGIDPALIS